MPASKSGGYMCVFVKMSECVMWVDLEPLYTQTPAEATGSSHCLQNWTLETGVSGIGLNVHTEGGRDRVDEEKGPRAGLWSVLSNSCPIMCRQDLEALCTVMPQQRVLQGDIQNTVTTLHSQHWGLFLCLSFRQKSTTVSSPNSLHQTTLFLLSATHQ